MERLGTDGGYSVLYVNVDEIEVIPRDIQDAVGSGNELHIAGAGKIEGINQKIKTLRRHGYGYPDDEYFFLKLFDMSRQDYVRNPKSHRICD